MFSQFYPRALALLGDFFYKINQHELSYKAYKYALGANRNAKSSIIHQRIGAYLGSKSKYILSESHLKRSLRIDPSNTKALTNLGQIFYIKGDLSASTQRLEESHRILPNNYKTLYHLGYVYFLSNKLSKSLLFSKESLSQNSNFLPAAKLSLNVSERLGDFKSMKDAAERITAIDPTDWRSRLYLGKIHLEYFNLNDAIRELSLADALMPNNSSILLETGRAYAREGNFKKADHFLNLSLEKTSDSDFQTLLDHGRAHNELKNYTLGAKTLGKACSLQPENLDAAYHRAHALLQDYRYDEAINELKKLETSLSNHFGWLSNIGQAYSEIGQPETAIRYLKAAISIRNEDPASHWNLSLALLATEKYDEGWSEYEWRWKIPDIVARRERQLTFENPPWNHTDPIQDKIVVLPEQGLGDVIQFLRYLEPFQAYVGKNVTVTFFPGSKLGGIVAYSKACKYICTAEEALATSTWIPLLSIPKVLGINSKNSTPKTPYIFANPAITLSWYTRFRSQSEVIIGIHWQGRSLTEVRGLQGRSFPLKIFETLALNHDSITFVSLQKGEGIEQLGEISFLNRFVDCQEEVTNIMDFQETASMIMACDLIITSDTALAHLSGSLGQETWLLLPTNADWRWGTSASETHWYPTMKLFRQQTSGDWQGLINDVDVNLSHWLMHKRQAFY